MGVVVRDEVALTNFVEELSGLVGDNVLWAEDARMLCVLAWEIFRPDSRAEWANRRFRQASRLAASYDLHASRSGGKLWLENGTHTLAVPALEDR